MVNFDIKVLQVPCWAPATKCECDMAVCLQVFALWWTGDLSRVYTASRPMSAGMGFSPLCPHKITSNSKFFDYTKKDAV